MEVKILPNGKKKYYYMDKDIVIQLSTKKQYQVKEVKDGNILTYSNEVIPLTTDIKATQETLDNAIIKKIEPRNKSSKSLSVKVKYFDKDMPRLEKIEKGDWIDVRVVSVKINGQVVDFMDGKVNYKQGDFIQAYLGFAMELPTNKEAHVAPRGSSYKNYGTIQTNSVGVVDESFKGNNDVWFIPLLAMRDGSFTQYDRIGQFRIMDKMPQVDLIEVDSLDNADRGGHGSTGTK